MHITSAFNKVIYPTARDGAVSINNIDNSHVIESGLEMYTVGSGTCPKTG